MKSFFTARVAVVSLIAALGASPLAQACRDCPFPSKIADGRWLMPNGHLQIEIDEIDRAKDIDEIHVVLRDARTGLVVAKGMSVQRPGRRTVTVHLKDRQGRQINGFVHYLNRGKDKIEAKFTCTECLIQPMLD